MRSLAAPIGLLARTPLCPQPIDAPLGYISPSSDNSPDQPALAGDEARKLTAWQNAAPSPLRNPSQWRIDCDGRLICWVEYGSMSVFGWEVDDAHPTDAGDADSSSDLRARHWVGYRTAEELPGAALKM